VESVAEIPAFAFEYARWPRRMASSLIDLLTLTAISLPFVAPTLTRAIERTPESATRIDFTASEIRTFTILGVIVQIVYMTVMHSWRGSTIGKMATRTMLVRDDGAKVNAATAFTRAVTVVGINFIAGWLFFIPVITNELRPLWHPRRQTWHDQIAKTVVVQKLDQPVKNG
jgi:uncharacterized RDD family membrane protein YckC